LSSEKDRRRRRVTSAGVRDLVSLTLNERRPSLVLRTGAPFRGGVVTGTVTLAARTKQPYGSCCRAAR